MKRRGRNTGSSQDGFTLVELIIVVAMGTVILLGSYAVLDSSARQSTRITERIDANQRARPALQGIMDQLRSSCVAAGAAPIRTGSSSSSIRFLHQTGDAVNVVPELVVISVVGNDLVRSTFGASGGSAPDWTFTSTPATTRVVLTGVNPAQTGTPAADTPYFRYYAHGDNGAVLTTPLSVPLSATDSARTTQVSVSYSVGPARNSTRDERAEVSVSNTVTLRFTPASEITADATLPCA